MEEREGGAQRERERACHRTKCLFKGGERESEREREHDIKQSVFLRERERERERER